MKHLLTAVVEHLPHRTSRPWRPWQQTGSLSSNGRKKPTLSGRLAGYTLTLLSLTAVHGIRYYNEPQLTIGSRSPQTFLAPAAAEIEDVEATQARQVEARRRVVQALQLSSSANDKMQQDLEALWASVEAVRQQAGSLPYVSVQLLSLPTQIYLRQLAPEDWEPLQDRARQEAIRTRTSTLRLQEDANPAERPDQLPPEQRAKQELIEVWQRAWLDGSATLTPAEDPYTQLVAQVEAAQRQYQAALLQLEQLTPPTPATVLNLVDPDWQQLQQQSRRVLERIQKIGIVDGLPREVRAEGIQAQLDDLTFPGNAAQRQELQALVYQWLNQVLTPNVEVDPQRTDQRIRAEIEKVEPVLISVTENQVIVRANQTITPEIFLVLDHFGLTQRGVNIWGLVGVAGLMGMGLAIFVPLQKRLKPDLRRRDRVLILMVSLTAPLLAALFKLEFSSLPAVGLLLGSFYGAGLGLVVVVGQALLLPLVAPASLLAFAPLLSGSVVACALAGRSRSREELALLGGGAALVQMLAYGAVSLATTGGIDLLAMALAGGTSLGWSIVALGASPYLERLFDLVTPIRLLELGNPNRTLLRRLAAEAPGTFQHTLFVATLAERAAQKLNLNVELVRTGTLYHDIGKMLQARYFIENQMGSLNPHTQLDDPYRSAQIIKAHVSDGLRLAKQYNLPTAVRAFIPEHQGTILIAYFYHQAQLKAGDQPVPQEPFRYDGPIPQSKETGVVMMADACEAALRSMTLSDGFGSEVMERARATVQKIAKARWQDGQLADSGLTLEDLEVVAEAFVEVWRESNHERIPYPTSTPTPPLSDNSSTNSSTRAEFPVLITPSTGSL
ncbi:HD family phosphohydrolase [Thermostichus vulcanus]|uniref:HDIG domain-containing protein n=1 Tax=Thermostichus vulcanus str. 'Rupite' TaxID=2813851 RepID=A0ABT0CB95_THEVL|nr:HDIG domain-containing metalloprotein [Thermostichus vulcanus]MCJ2543026.1 HDIG domain-containing protein [Thermostichus vulcanus str. 'Rupite']